MLPLESLISILQLPEPIVDGTSQVYSPLFGTFTIERTLSADGRNAVGDHLRSAQLRIAQKNETYQQLEDQRPGF